MLHQNSLFSGAALGYLSFFQATLEPIMSSMGYSNYFSGLCGALIFICGIFGSFVLGTLLHFIGQQHCVAFVKLITSILILMFAGFIFVMHLPDQSVILASMCSVFGFSAIVETDTYTGFKHIKHVCVSIYDYDYDAQQPRVKNMYNAK